MATFVGNYIGAVPIYNSPFERKAHDGHYLAGAPTSGGSSDVTPPVLVITVPTVPTEPLLITITEAASTLRVTECSIKIGTGSRIVAYDEVESFLTPYNGRSTIVGTGTILDPLVITLYRFGNWPTGIPIDAKIKAVDSAGNKVIE